jgi:hypothetical protein
VLAGSERATALAGNEWSGRIRGGAVGMKGQGMGRGSPACVPCLFGARSRGPRSYCGRTSLESMRVIARGCGCRIAAERGRRIYV